MKLILSILFVGAVLSPVGKYGKHYRRHHDFESLQQAVDLIEPGTDTTAVKALLGPPVDMGFEYRYLTDSVDENNCPVGAAFRFTDGRLTDRFVVPFCE